MAAGLKYFLIIQASLDYVPCLSRLAIDCSAATVVGEEVITVDGIEYTTTKISYEGQFFWLNNTLSEYNNICSGCTVPCFHISDITDGQCVVWSASLRAFVPGSCGSGGFTCDDVLECLGISEGGNPALFLNQQGDFVAAGGGSTPTFQQTLSVAGGSILTQNNTIDQANHTLAWINTKAFSLQDGGGNKFFNTEFDSGLVAWSGGIGDITGVNNGTNISWDDSSSTINFYGLIGTDAYSNIFSFQGGAGLIEIGDLDGSQNSTKFSLSDTAQTITLTAVNGVLNNLYKDNGGALNINQTTAAASLGLSTASGTISIASGADISISSTDAAIAIQSGTDLLLQSSGGFINIDPAGHDIQLSGAALPSSTSNQIDDAFFTGGGKLTITNGFITAIT